MPNSATPANIMQHAAVQVGGATSPPPPAPVVVAGPLAPLEVTKYQFRQLFTTAEKMAIDNAQYNTALTGSMKAAINTMQIDLNVSAMVDLHLPATIRGVNFLVSIGMLTAARAAHILANVKPQ
jgi:hypothetical protein